MVNTNSRDSAPGTASELLALALVLFRSWRMIGAFAALGTLLAATIILLLPPSFSVGAMFVPRSGDWNSRPALSAIASQFGVTLPGSADSPSAQFYTELIGTRALLVPILDLRLPREVGSTDTISLAEYLEVDFADSSQRSYRGAASLKRRLGVGASKTTGIISVQATFPRPDAAYLVAQAVVRGVDAYLSEARRNVASEERRFVEARLVDAQATLRAEELRLEAFLRGNRQFTESPALVQERERIGREISLRQQVYISLAQSLEDVRIREVRTATTISVVDPPRFNSRPNDRNFALSIVLGLFVGALFGAAVSVAVDAWRRMISTGDVVAVEWQKLVQGSQGG